MDILINQIIEEISERREIDLYSFHMPYLISQIDKRIFDLNLRSRLEYYELVSVDPKEPDLFYYNYLYGFSESQLHNRIFPESIQCIHNHIMENNVEEFKVWIPLTSDKITIVILSCILEDLKYQNAIRNYNIYATHPTKERILKLRNKHILPIGSVDIPDDWKTHYMDMVMEDEYELKSNIRIKSVFANHDFLTDNPIKSLNMVILNGYFHIYSQFRRNLVLRQFYESLKDNGIIITSESNVEREFTHYFQPIQSDRIGNFYKKKKGLVPIPKTSLYTPYRYSEQKSDSLETKILNHFFDKEEIAYLVITDNGNLIEMSTNLLSGLNLKEGTLNYKWEELFTEDLTGTLRNLLLEFQKSNIRIKKNFSSDHPSFQGRFNQVMIQSIQSSDSKSKYNVIYFWNGDSASEKDNREKYERAIREIHHRVKNQMTILFSLMDLELDSVFQSETKELIQRFAARLHSIEIVQNRMSESPFTLKVPLKTIIQDFIIFLNSRLFKNSLAIPIQFTFDADELELPSRMASPILLALSEVSSILMRNIPLQLAYSPEMYLNCNQSGDKILVEFGILTNAIHDLSSNTEWIHANNLEKSILEANTKQIHCLLSKEAGIGRFQYSLLIPVI